jgi:MFS family permease
VRKSLFVKLLGHRTPTHDVTDSTVAQSLPLETQVAGGAVLRSIIACLVGTFVLRMAASVMGNMLQLYYGYIDAHEYPLSFTLRSIATAIFFLPELVGSPVLGSWSDRYGRKLFIVIGPLSGAIAVQLTAMTTNFGVLAFTRLLEGLSTASAIPATLGYLSAMTSHNESLRGRVMGIFEIATIGGTLGGLIIGGTLWSGDLVRGISGPAAFSIDSGIYLASLAIFLLGMTEVRRKMPNHRTVEPRETVGNQLHFAADALRQTWKSIRAALSSSRILRFVPAWLAINMILGAWLNNVVGQLVETSGRFPNQLLYGIFAENARAGTQISIYGSAVFGVFGLGIALWSLTFGRFRRTSVMLVSAVGLFILCGFIFALNHVGDPSASKAVRLGDPLVAFYAAGALIAFMIVSGFTPAALTYLADVTEDDPRDRGAIMGLYSVFFGVGQLFGTLIGGPFVDWRGMDGLITFTAILGLGATFTLIRLHQNEVRAHSNE